jgi:hypothetical protein
MLPVDRRRHILFVVLLFLTGVSAIGQAEVKDENSREFRERIQRMKLNKLVEILRLNDEKELDFRKTYAEQQRKVESAREALDAATKKLQDLVQADAPSAQLTSATDETARAVSAMIRSQEQRSQAVRPLLTPAQYARYVLFELRFQEILRRIMKRQREQR